MPKITRVADPVSCGDHLAEGSPDVFANNLPVVRLNDPTTGHGCFPSTVIISTVKTVYANNILVSAVGVSNIETHCCVICHSGSVSDGSPNVFAEG